MTTVQFDTTRRIVHRLVLQAKFMRDPGLFHGQMGIVIAMSRLYRKTGNEAYENYMGDLLDVLMGNIHAQVSCSFADGLAGIGWGVEYLIQNDFVEGSSLETCQEADRRLLQLSPSRLDLTLENGLEGLLHYVLAHLQGCIAQHDTLPFDEDYLNGLDKAVDRISAGEASGSLEALAAQYRQFRQSGQTAYRFDPAAWVCLPTLANGFEAVPLGLRDGLAACLFLPDLQP